MPRYHHAQNNFTGGEISPRMSGAIDQQVYQRGLSRCTNFIVLPQGGAYRRLGSVYQLPALGNNGRLITFGDDTSDYIVELGNQKIRVLRGDSVELDTSTPWTTDMLFEVSHVQDGDEMFFFHRKAAPQVLTKGWAFGSLDVIGIPDYHFEDEVGATAQVQVIQIGPATANWTDGDWFRLVVDGQESARAFYSSDEEVMAGRIERILKPLVLQGGKGLISGLTVVADAPADPQTFTVTYDTGLLGLDWLIQPGDGEAVAAAAAISVAVTVPATGECFEPAWSAARGYPGACAFYQERLWAAGTTDLPQTLWASRPGSSNDFEVGPEDGDALSFKFKSTKRVSVQWMSGKRGLAVGTTAGDWVIPREVRVVTPSNVEFARQTGHRSARLMPVEVDSETLYIQSGAQKVRQFIYEWGAESWQSYDMTYFSQHITGTGLKQLAFADHPDSLIWGVTEEGVITCMTYERAQEIVCWHKHTTDGVVKSIAVRHNGGADELCMLVTRRNGSFIECIPFSTQEYYQQDSIIDDDTDPSEVPFAPRTQIRDFDAFMDSAIHFTGPVETVTAFHLRNQQVAVMADGANLEGLSADAYGAINLGDSYNNVWVGLPYSSSLKLLPIEVPSQSGTSQSMRVRYVRPSLRLADSQLPMVNGVRPADRDLDTLMGTPEGMVTGDVEVSNWGHERGQVEVEADLPYPCHVVMIFGWIEMGME